MGGASLYLYLYFVCGGGIVLLAGLAGALWFVGRKSNPRGVTTPVKTKSTSQNGD